MPRILIICFLLLCIALPASAVRWTDAVGRSVEVPEAPRRIVSLVPSVTEILFALGLGDRIAGVTRFCTYPPQAQSKPQVGGYADPSLEAVAAREPDLVFLSADSASPALLSRIERLGIPAYVVYPRGIEETIEMIRAVGQVGGAPAAGERMAQQITADIERIRTATGGSKRPRVLFCVMVHPLTVAGPETLVGDLIEFAGGENVVPAGTARYPTWGAESMLVADPDLIVVSPHPGTPEPATFFAAWPELEAVRKGRILSVEPNWVHRPGPRLILGLAALAKGFHDADVSVNVPGERP